MFGDLNNKIESFYQMTDSQGDSLLMELNSRINRDPDKFKIFMDELGYGLESNRPIFYEALVKRDPNNWKDYIFHELTTLIRTAESGDEDALYEVDSIYWLADIKGMENSFYEKTKDFLFTKLNSNTPRIREYVLASIMDVFDIIKDKPSSSELVQLRNCLKDSDFKNKIYAYAELKTAKLLPSDFKFTMIEKIKIKLEGYSMLYNS